MVSRVPSVNVRRDPVRVVVQSYDNNPHHHQQHGTHHGDASSDDSDSDHHSHHHTNDNTCRAAAIIWISNRAIWTKRITLTILAIIIMIALVQLSHTPNASSISSLSSSRNSLSTNDNDALLGGPPSWRQRQYKEQQQHMQRIEDNNGDVDDDAATPTQQRQRQHERITSEQSTKPSKTRSPTYRSRPPRRTTIDNVNTSSIGPSPTNEQSSISPVTVPVSRPTMLVDGNPSHDDTMDAPQPRARYPNNNDITNNTMPIIITKDTATFVPLPMGTRCVNSVQGVYHVADSSGAVCTRRALTSSGCCNRERRLDDIDDDHYGSHGSGTLDVLSCRGCRPELKCCDSFEYCTSCCLASKPLPLDGVLVYDNDVFEQCLHLCRTSSRSLKGVCSLILPFPY
jgi:hypothetical protein